MVGYHGAVLVNGGLDVFQRLLNDACGGGGEGGRNVGEEQDEGGG